MLVALGEDDGLEKMREGGEGIRVGKCEERDAGGTVGERVHAVRAMRVGKCEERDAGGTVGERDPCSEGDEGREM